ncbi:MAG: hypothetical protein ACYTF9_07625, partial [Planctomycetota bacterium]
MDDSEKPGPRSRRPSPDPAFDAWSIQDAFDRLDGTSLAAMFDSLPASVWMTDAELALTFVQGPLIAHLRVSSRTLVGRRLPELLAREDRDLPFIGAHHT